MVVRVADSLTLKLNHQIARCASNLTYLQVFSSRCEHARIDGIKLRAACRRPSRGDRQLTLGLIKAQRAEASGMRRRQCRAIDLEATRHHRLSYLAISLTETHAISD